MSDAVSDAESNAAWRLEQWFASRGWSPFTFQRDVWQAYANGESGLIHAATGTGKTYAAWMGPVLEALADAEFLVEQAAHRHGVLLRPSR